MTEENKVIIRYEIDPEGNAKNIDRINGLIVDQNRVLKENKAEQRKVRKEHGENSEQLKRLQKTEALLKDGLKSLNSERREAVKQSKLQANSLALARKRTSELTKTRDQLNLATKSGRKQFEELTKKIKENNDFIQKADKDAGNFKSSIGGYEQAITSALGPMGTQIESLKRIVQGLNASKVALATNTKALGTFKKAMISTGIGALVVAIGTLVTFLTRTQRGLDSVNVLFEGMGAVIDVVLDRLSLVGEAISLLFSGEFSRAFEVAKSAVSGVGDEIVKEFGKAQDLEKAYQGLQDKQNEFIVTRAQGEEKIAELRLKASEMRDKDNAKALQYLEDARKVSEWLLAEELALAEEEARISRERLNLGESTREDVEETNMLEARVFELRKARLMEQKRLENESLTLRRQIEGEAQKDAVAEQKRQEEKIQRQKELTEAQKETTEAINEMIEESNEELAEIDDEFSDQLIEQGEQRVNSLIAQEERLNQERSKIFSQGQNLLFSALNQSLIAEDARIGRSYDKRQKDLQKALQNGLITQEEYDKKTAQLEKQRATEEYKVAVAQFKVQQAEALAGIAIDTATNVVEAWPNPFLIASALALGGAQALIVSQQTAPAPPIFEDGGEVPLKSGTFGGKPHAFGGTDLFDSSGNRIANVEADEKFFVLNKRASEFIDGLDNINQKFGGRSFRQPNMKFLREGGQISVNDDGQVSAVIKQTLDSFLKNSVISVQVSDIINGVDEFQNTVNVGIEQS